MSISEPYLHPESNQNLCIICNATITKKNEQGIVRDWCKKVHESYRTNIRLKYSKYKIEEPLMENERNCEVLTTAQSELLSVDTEPSIPCTRSVISSPTEKRTCFVCKTNTGKNISRISKVCVAAEADTSKTIHLNNPNSYYHLAAKRLNIMLQRHAVDLYAADICYHNHCLVYFNRFFFFFFMHFFSGTKHPREDNPNLYYWAEMTGLHTQTCNI